MEKLNVCVIFGGKSSEHEVSKMSAKTVLCNIDEDKYNVYKIFITTEGEWLFYEGTPEDVTLSDSLLKTSGKAFISPDCTEQALYRICGDKTEKIHIDIAYPVLHGKYGEDGTVQGLFELAGIPYVGSGVIGSACCMDKCIAKILFEKAEIDQSAWIEIKKGDKLDLDAVEEKLGMPVFVKPSSAGSSVGVTKVKSKNELNKAVELAFKHDYKVLIEEAIDAREIEISVMGNLEPSCADFPGEIMPSKDFYDFEAKYEDENSKLMIPANIDAATVEKIKEIAKKAYKICECRGHARVDFFIDRKSGRLILNEINTIPGFTPISMYPKLWDKSGVDIKTVIDKHIKLALSRGDC